MATVTAIMPGFRWDVRRDITLCIEAVKSRPQKPQEWEEVASVLNELFCCDVKLKGRGCKERLQLLVKKYKEEDARALKRHVVCCNLECEC